MRKILGSYNDKAIGVIDKYEGYIFNFYHNHPIITSKLVTFASLWLIAAICIITMFSIVGASYGDKHMQEEYKNGTIDQDNFESWNNLVMPAYTFSLSTIQYILYAFAILMCYFIIRTAIKYY